MRKLALLTSLFLTGNAFASVGIYTHASTLGAGVGAEYPFSDSFTGRLEINRGSLSKDTSHDDIDYKADLQLKTFGGLLDWHPFAGSGFRITGGAYINRNRIDLKGTSTASGTITLDGTTYTANAGESLSADAKVKMRGEFSSYFGLGYSTVPNAQAGFGIQADIGILNQSPKVTLSVAGVDDSSGTLEANRAAEEKKLQKDADKLSLYPVVSLGVSYRF
jgi:hypothetical protein